MKLEEIAQLMIGVLAKRERDTNGENSYLLFSLKDYEEKQEYEELKTNKNLNNKLAKEGDLLFRLIYPNKVIYVDKNIEGLLVPSQFCIIRTQKEEINPIVLKWYLESNNAKEELNSKITGSIIKSMTLANLKTLEIPYVPSNVQNKMQKLIELGEQEKIITKKILEEKEKLYNSYLTEMMKKGEINVGK